MNTPYFMNCVMGNVFGTKETPALPANYYIGLSTTAPVEGSSGYECTEPASSAGYARVKLTSLSEPTGGVITNTANIDFAESTAAWGVITHFVIYDALTGGNMLIYGPLSKTRTVESETAMTIRTGYLSLTLQNPTA